jgi:replicative DNA helicase
MNYNEQIKQFYLENLEAAAFEGTQLRSPCPFCAPAEGAAPGTLVVDLDTESFFYGYFRCLSRCKPGGFPLHFAKLRGINVSSAPGYDPDRTGYVRSIVFPAKNLNNDVKKYHAMLTKNQLDFFASFGVSMPTLQELQIGFNGRYLIYPYVLENGNCYASRCILPANEADNFWAGDEAFYGTEFQVFNAGEIDRCENGALLITDGERNLLTLKELGYPAIAVPDLPALEALDPDRLAHLRHVLIVLNNSPEAQSAARTLATKLGFKVRILRWPPDKKRDYSLLHLYEENPEGFAVEIERMVRTSKSFSPFSSPEREHREFIEVLDKNIGREVLGVPTGFELMDNAMNGIRGINILGGQPKAGKSCFFMQVSTEAARRGMPVIYYDFENGREKIYMRTLCRLSRLSEEELRKHDLPPEASERLSRAKEDMKSLFNYFRVVTDRKLSPDVMRRQIDFIKHETRLDQCLVIIDSLHKLPFKNLSERRTGIDEWLRIMESIRDEQKVSFLVISELSRAGEGGYNRMPDLGSFKESGDIEYSADNAIILQPNWDLLDPLSTRVRENGLWLVASRESSPGKVADYVLDFPYWGFVEKSPT